MTITDDLLKKVTMLGMLGYNVDKCANILDISTDDKPDFVRDFNRPSSDLRQAYQRGRDKADFEIDKKLFEQAKAGDMKAMEMFERRRAEQDDTD